MRRSRRFAGTRSTAALCVLAAALACAPARQAGVTPRSASPSPSPASPAESRATEGVPSDLRIAPDVAERVGQFPPTKIDYDRSLLDDRETAALRLLIEASRELEGIFERQVAEEVPAMRERVARLVAEHAPRSVPALEYFDVMKGPWDRLKGDEPFVGTRPKPPGAGFYPVDMTKDEFEKWIAAHPAEKGAFQGLFTVIRRDGARLVATPYSKEYAAALSRSAAKLREAAAMTANPSLRKFLTLRADAFLSDDYFASDVAWMDLDSDIEIAIGPYEVYEDRLFNYKAAFESFVTVRDKAESAHLAVYAQHLPDMEKNLPIPDQHKNFNRKFESPIRVVQEAFTSGDARRGVQTSAFNLPNDERVREAKGSKKVLLKNVMSAKFAQSGHPVAERVLDPSQTAKVAFEPYFNHTLFHELSHGLGPGVITGPDGKRVEARLLLKNIYSTIEECKADVVGLWNILYALDRKWLSGFDAEALAATYTGLMFRSMRFGLEEAHGGGTAVQWNWFREKGAIVPSANGRFLAKPEKFREAVRTLGNELLMIEATGDYDRGKRLLDRYGKSNAEIESTNARLKDIPVDIKPVFAAAGEN
ncbi:MAG: peptidase [Acidobacteriota bacterium]|nr:peptidase [Acidobacteriota bacterium]